MYGYKTATGQPHPLVKTTGAKAATYEYDKAGNTTGRPGAQATQTLAWNTEGELAATTEPAAGNKPALGTTYLYDADGELLIRRATGDGDTVLYLGATEVRLTTKGTTRRSPAPATTARRARPSRSAPRRPAPRAASSVSWRRTTTAPAASPWTPPPRTSPSATPPPSAPHAVRSQRPGSTTIVDRRRHGSQRASARPWACWAVKPHSRQDQWHGEWQWQWWRERGRRSPRWRRSSVFLGRSLLRSRRSILRCYRQLSSQC
ncbi:hypothetical protein ACVWZD_003707 [Streptomyces sp. TE3672]